MYSLPHRFLSSVLEGVFHFFRCERGAAVGLRHNFIECCFDDGIEMRGLPHLRLERLVQVLGRDDIGVRKLRYPPVRLERSPQPAS